MSPNPGTEKPYLRDDSGVRRAAMVVIDELGEDAAEYAITRAMVLQRQGDDSVAHLGTARASRLQGDRDVGPARTALRTRPVDELGDR